MGIARVRVLINTIKSFFPRQNVYISMLLPYLPLIKKAFLDGNSISLLHKLQTTLPSYSKQITTMPLYNSPLI
jgi:hypothetical protein